MDWILRKSRKFDYHTNLSAVLQLVSNDIDKFNWFLSDLEFGDLRADTSTPLPINHEEDYFILAPEDFQKLLDAEPQIIWGVVLAVPKEQPINLNINKLPYADGNGGVFQTGGIQLNNAVIEIDCFDSSYTILKFQDERLSKLFSSYFEEAVPLDKFRG